MTESRITLLLAVAGVIALALLPQFADRYYIQLFTRIMVMAIFAMSLGLLVSGAGLVSFGHAAFFGLGAYILALLSLKEAASAWLALPAALAGTALAALLVGALAVRTAGIYFIMLTLAFAQMFFFLFHDWKVLGGSDGLYLAARPTFDIGETRLLNLNNRPTLFYVVLGAMAGVYLLIGMLMRSPFGKVVSGIRINEHRMRALGYSTYRYKLVAFVIAGAIAGLAGFLYATQNTYVNPALMGWRESGLVLMMVILGGMRSRLGPVIGAFALVLVEDVFQGLTERWLLLTGIFVIAVVLLLPNGLAGLLERLQPKRKAFADD
ncbi:MAG TPA: branched-chain amino acid ABC transporter permease [Alphaproteobacteria bacterium]|nr:branched-chain amino acid ABC transporter permease [Alphaproteobacteria bacterium]